MRWHRGWFGLACGALAALCCEAAPAQAPPEPDSPAQRASLGRIHRQWTVEQGLPGNAVTALAMDGQRRLWVATLAGLARFDGVRFEVHDAARHHNLSSDRFTTLHRTPDSVLWLSNEQYELLRFDGERFSRVDGVSVLCVAASPDGWLAYGTTRGVFVVDARGARLLDDLEIHERVLELDWPETGTLLALTDAALVEIADPGGSTPILRRRREIPGPNSGALLRRADGSVLLGTRHGLRALPPAWEEGAETWLLHDPVVNLRSLDRQDVRVATPQRIGTLRGESIAWLGDNRDSLGEEPLQVRFGGAIWDVLADHIGRDASTSLAVPSRITDVLSDGDDNLWVATNASGLAQFRAAEASVLGRSEGLAGDNVYPVLADDEGTVWVGTLDGGLQRLRGDDPANWQRIALPFGAAWSLLRTRAGALWVGGDGVCELRGTACSSEGLPAEMLQQTPVRAMHEDPDGTLWVGTIWGLWRRDGETWRALAESDGTRPGRAARAFVDDGAARLWIATNGDGVLELQRGVRVRRIAVAQGLSSDVVRALWREPGSGALWIGTENRGVCRADVDAQPLRVRCLGREQGLPSGGVHAIVPDDGGRLWINSNQGVYTVDRGEFETRLAHGGRLTRTRLYDARSGLRSSEGNGGVSPAAARDREGRIWFPTQAGVAIFDPAGTDTRAPSVAARIDAAQLGTRTLQAPQRVVLEPPRRDVVLALGADSYRDPENVRFRYRLGDGDWIDAGTRRELALTRLPVGEWRLHLQARNPGTEWPDAATVLPLSVRPAWHERGSVRTLAVLLLALAVVVAFVWRGRRLRARQRELEALVASRTEDLVAAQRDTEAALATVQEQHAQLARLHRSRTEFAANISHELKTPLTLLTAPLADHPDIARVVGDELFAAMRDSGQRMQRLLRQLADLHLIDSAALKIERRDTAVNTFVAHCVQPFAALAQQRGLALELRATAGGEAAMAIDPVQFDKVLGNLLSNAIKFTPAPGRIAVSTAARDEIIEIAVEDSGPGVPPPHRDAIFERFYQVDGSASRAHEGSGIGLALAREIVTFHGGTLAYVESASGGAGFRVALPRAATGMATGTAASPKHRDTPAVAMDLSEEPVDARPRDERPRILLVEDQAALRTYLRQALAERYDVLEARNGHEGLALARAAIPDAIISDVMMPGMDGLEMTRHLRADAETRCIPLLFLTALDGEAQQLAGLLAGGDRYLTKPFSSAVVRAHVDSLLQRRSDLLTSLASPAMAPVPAPTDVPAPPTLRRRAEAVIRSHLGDEEFDLEILVRALATSRTQLHRRLQAEHGISPGELITATRLAAAAELLSAHRGSVTEVCYSVGFRSLSSFSRAFKLAHGCAPGEYAQRQATGNAGSTPAGR